MFWWFAKEFGSSHGYLHWWSAWSFGTRSPREIHIKREGTFMGNLWGVASVDGFRHIIYIYAWLHHYIILHIFIYTCNYIYIWYIHSWAGQITLHKLRWLWPWKLMDWFNEMERNLPSLKLTGPRPLKWWFPSSESLDSRAPAPIFRGKLAVSFREWTPLEYWHFEPEHHPFATGKSSEPNLHQWCSMLPSLKLT